MLGLRGLRACLREQKAYMDLNVKHAVQGIMMRVVISGLLLKGVAIITPSLMLRRMSTQRYVFPAHLPFLSFQD